MIWNPWKGTGCSVPLGKAAEITATERGIRRGAGVDTPEGERGVKSQMPNPKEEVELMK